MNKALSYKQIRIIKQRIVLHYINLISIGLSGASIFACSFAVLDGTFKNFIVNQGLFLIPFLSVIFVLLNVLWIGFTRFATLKDVSSLVSLVYKNDQVTLDGKNELDTIIKRLLNTQNNIELEHEIIKQEIKNDKQLIEIAKISVENDDNKMFEQSIGQITKPALNLNDKFLENGVRKY